MRDPVSVFAEIADAGARVEQEQAVAAANFERRSVAAVARGAWPRAAIEPRTPQNRTLKGA